jgi:excisionase family DNA binding protein
MTGLLLLRSEEAAEYLRLAPQTLNRMRCEGSSPPYIKLGRRVLYDRAELDAWIDKSRRVSTSDRGRPGSP